MKDRHDHAPRLGDVLQAAAGRVSFHMPGHRQGRFMPEGTSFDWAALDTTELPGTGDLNAPDGAVQAAYDRAARLFGAGKTWFITSGSTTSIFIMMAGMLREGDAVIVPRAVHMATVHAIAVLGVRPIFVAAEGAPFPDGQPTREAFIETIRRHPDARACFVLRPDYFGRAADLAPIVEAAHARGMAVGVDEAHGAHWAVGDGSVPATALSLGADVVCQSAHKTLPALTPASLLHLSEDAIEHRPELCERVAAMVQVFQTSSPSFPIAASIDMARAELEACGRARIERLIALHADIAERCPEGFRRCLGDGDDPTRLVLDFLATGRSRSEVARAFDRAGIDVEMIDLDRCVMLPALDQPAEDYARLLDVLRTLSSERRTTDPRPVRALARERDRLLSRPAEFVCSPRQALFGRVDDPRVARHVIAPYPPGMPTVWPGEPITLDVRTHIEALSREGIAVRGADGCVASKARPR